MQVRCKCGKVLKVPDSFAGKKARCPACGNITAIPAAPAARAAAPTKVTMQCACGKKLTAPVSAAGKKVLCPACSKELSVPGPAPAAPSSAPVAPPQAAAASEEELSLAIDKPEPQKAQPAEEYGVAVPECPNCHAKLEPSAQFCIQCGTHMATGARVETVDMETIKAKAAESRKVHYVVIAIAAGLVIIAALTFALVRMFGKRASGKRAPSAPAATAPAPAPAPAPKADGESAPAP